MIRAVVYYAGPATVWADAIDPREVIAESSHRWPWLARLWARSVHGSLDPRRCGWALFDGSRQLEQVAATDPPTGSVA